MRFKMQLVKCAAKKKLWFNEKCWIKKSVLYVQQYSYFTNTFKNNIARDFMFDSGLLVKKTWYATLNNLTKPIIWISGIFEPWFNCCQWFEFMALRSRVRIPKAGQILHKRSKRTATASTFTQVAVLPWRYDSEMGTTNSLHASA